MMTEVVDEVRLFLSIRFLYLWFCSFESLQRNIHLTFGVRCIQRTRDCRIDNTIGGRG
jgi:hypothetical protein